MVPGEFGVDEGFLLLLLLLAPSAVVADGPDDDELVASGRAGVAAAELVPPDWEADVAISAADGSLPVGGTPAPVADVGDVEFMTLSFACFLDFDCSCCDLYQLGLYDRPMVVFTILR